jgi:hypothetical protein
MRKLLIASFLFSLLLFPLSCTYDKFDEVEECDNSLMASLADQTSSACGIASGSITAAVIGETAGTPVTFSLNGSSFQDDPEFTDLAAGTYSLTVKQGICTSTLEITLENAEGLKAAAEATPSNCGSASGSISITTTDASGAVSYSLNGGAAQSAPTFTGLAPGNYQIAVTDGIGCQVSLEATILSTVAFAEIESIVTSSCAISGCHAGNVSPDFRVRENILSRSGRIGVRTGNSSMPPPSSGNSLSQSDIDAISCWVADGAPE